MTRKNGTMIQKLKHLGLKVGDRVYKHSPRGRKGLSTKFIHHWIGPYLVKGVNDVNAQIKPVGGLDGLPEIVHINNLKKYSGRTISNTRRHPVFRARCSGSQSAGDHHKP